MSITLRFGATRVVVLYGPYAFKVARVRPIKVLLKFIATLSCQRQSLSLLEKYDSIQPTIAFTRYLFAGIYANRLEAKHWSATTDPKVAPVHWFCPGWLVLVQQRVGEVSHEELLQCEYFAPMYTGSDRTELHSPHQFGRNCSGRIVVVDYGSPLTLRALRQE
jgi:hypothetical protein